MQTAATRAELRPSDLRAEKITDFLRTTSLFNGCPPSVINQISTHVRAFDVAAKHVILRAGAPDAIIGVVFSGEVAARQVNAATGQSQIVDSIRPGDHFGEVGALLGTAQPFEVAAMADSTIVLLGNEVVTELSSKVASFSNALAKKLSARVVKASVFSLRAPTGGPLPTPSPTNNTTPGGDGDTIHFVQVGSYDLTDNVLRLLPANIIQEHRVLPLAVVGRTLTVGMVNPYNVRATTEIKKSLSSVDTKIVAISIDDFNEALVRLRISGGNVTATARKEPVPINSITYESVEERESEKAVRVIGDEVISSTTRIIAAGLEYGASDIHIEAKDTGILVRYRVSGTLIDWDQYIAPSFAKALVARLKVLAGLNITERRLPQDGRIGLKVGRRELDLRLSTLPTSRGEKLVLRIFEAASMMRPLEQIFFEPNTLTAVRHALNRPYGAIVVAGPTGSGKSSTLYASLNERRKTRPDTNIIMVEDPIEYRLQGVTQVQVNHGIKLGFAQVLRAMLRQDPDVIMVGEVRDQETAMLALEAAMTGHLLFTSLHANNAVSAIQRLENLGCGRPVVAQSLALVLIQRLARKLCSHCTTQEIPPPMLLASLTERGLAEKSAPVPLPRAVGCDKCNHTGFLGRIAVLESLAINEDIRHSLMLGEPLDEVESIALHTDALIPFSRYASYLMTRGMLSPADALLMVAG